MPWEETDQFIRSGHRSPDDFEQGSLRTITLSEEEGIKAVIGKPKGKDTTEVQSYLFAKDKGWTVDKAKVWFEKHHESKVKEHVSAILPLKVLEKIVDKPLKIRGIAMTAGMSRNFNIYTPEELHAFANKLVSASIYAEHVAVPNACGKVTKTDWDSTRKISSVKQNSTKIFRFSWHFLLGNRMWVKCFLLISLSTNRESRSFIISPLQRKAFKILLEVQNLIQSIHKEG